MVESEGADAVELVNGEVFTSGPRVHYRETSLVTSNVLVIGARNGFARNDLVTTS